MNITKILWLEENKTSISQAKTYKEIGEFWDTHDLGDYWEQTYPVEFEIDIKSSKTYFAVESTLSSRIADLARKRGISSETLLNLWVQEKLQETYLKPIYQIAEE